MERHTLTLEEPFSFEAGGELSGLEIAYHTSPHPYRKGEKVIWI